MTARCKYSADDAAGVMLFFGILLMVVSLVVLTVFAVLNPEPSSRTVKYEYCIDHGGDYSGVTGSCDLP